MKTKQLSFDDVLKSDEARDWRGRPLTERTPRRKYEEPRWMTLKEHIQQAEPEEIRFWAAQEMRTMGYADDPTDDDIASWLCDIARNDAIEATFRERVVRHDT